MAIFRDKYEQIVLQVILWRTWWEDIYIYISYLKKNKVQNLRQKVAVLEKYGVQFWNLLSQVDIINSAGFELWWIMQNFSEDSFSINLK